MLNRDHSEISVELRFPSSGLTRLNYTTAFPPPPLSSLTEHLYQEEHGSNKLDLVAHSPGVQDEVERSWYYYLADIAARRILERVVDTFYVKEAVSLFHTTLPELIDTAKELQRQLTQWSVNIRTSTSQADAVHQVPKPPRPNDLLQRHPRRR